MTPICIGMGWDLEHNWWPWVLGMGVVGLEQNGLLGHAHVKILLFGCMG